MHASRLPWSLLLAAALLHRPGEARACSCDETYKTTVPADGATDVPLDVRIILRNFPGPWPDPGYVLRGPFAVVPVAIEEIEQHGAHHMLVLTPAELLAPNTLYTLESEFFERSFTTGVATDDTSPSAPTVGELALATAALANETSCGSRFSDVDLPMELPADAVAFELTFRTDGWSQRYLLLPDDLPRLAALDDSCAPSIPLQPDAHYDLEIRARDLAGNLSPAVHRADSAFRCPDITGDGFDLPDGLEGCADPDPTVMPPDDDRDGGCAAAPGGSPLLVALVLLVLSCPPRPRRSSPSRAAAPPP